jgi:hypothetical protein
MKTNELTFVIIALLCVLGLMKWYSDKEEWQQFKHAHNCQEIGEMEGSLSPSVGISSNGSAVMTGVFNRPKTGYKCDNGRVYWK